MNFARYISKMNTNNPVTTKKFNPRPTGTRIRERPMMGLDDIDERFSVCQKKVRLEK